MSDFLPICEEAARVGGEVLREWAGRIAAREKAPADLVTEADFASQEAIRKFLASRHPEHDFLGEEGEQEQPRSSPYRWIVDPLDGTTNYVHGLPNYGVSVALEKDGEIIAGVVFDPNFDECFAATAGGGAFLNGEHLQVSGVTNLSEALVAVSFAPKVRPNAPEIEHFLQVLPLCQAVRRMGSAALNLSYIAAGRLDGYWATTTHLWDVAAGMLILREAGGLFTGFQGEPFDPDRPSFIAAATSPLHAELRAALHP